MQKLFPSWSLLPPLLLLVACGDGNPGVDRHDGGDAAQGRDASGTGGSAPGSGGISGTGGTVTGSGGIAGTGGSVPGTGGISPTGGSGSGGQTSSDMHDSGTSALDAPSPDAPMDGSVTYDGLSCPAPKVWRYQAPGCDADAHPVCGSIDQDACPGYACGCDGKILGGCDYFSQPWRSKGICPDMCLSPTQNLDAFTSLGYIPVGLIKGCACNPASDAPQCIQNRGFLFSCVDGTWKLELVTCPAVDAGGDGQVAPDAPADNAVAPGCDVATAEAAMAALGLLPAGPAETLNDTLPSPISGPNWGLKATMCQDGGYDISGLAGQTVCLVKQPIAQACAKAPNLAWAVMTDGKVRCVYESDDSNPGVYPANGGNACTDN